MNCASDRQKYGNTFSLGVQGGFWGDSNDFRNEFWLQIELKSVKSS